MSGSSLPHVAIICIVGSCLLATPALSALVDSSSTVDDSVRITVTEGWNLVSIPLIPTNRATSALFPNAISKAYRFAGRYVTAESLDVGIGYWLKFKSPDTISLVGTIPITDTMVVRKGWNMIGPIGKLQMSTSKFSGQFRDLGIASSFYAYQNGAGYGRTDMLHPGRGYWVKTAVGGQVVLNETPPFVPEYTLDDTAEAEGLALWLSGELRASDSLASALLYNLNYLRFVYDDSVRYCSQSVLSCRRFQPPWSISAIDVKFDPAATQQVLGGEYTGWNQLDSTLRPTSIPYPPNRQGWAMLRFDGYLHPVPLAALYSSLPGIIQAVPSGWLFGDWDTYPIFPRKIGNDLSYVFTRGFVLGYTPWWYFKYEDGVPHFIGVRCCLDDPEPWWWQEAMLNESNFRYY